MKRRDNPRFKLMRFEPARRGHPDKIIFCKMGDFQIVAENYYDKYCDLNSERDTKDWLVYDNKSVHTWMNPAITDII